MPQESQEFSPKIDYSLRPAKATARRMIAETLVRLQLPMPIWNYRYVGMGSIFFRDFLLFHRVLGINDMISIEHEINAETRARFNLPLACIDLRMGSAADVLPRIELEEKPHVVWLDYESNVHSGVIADISEVVNRCSPGSILFVTVNADRVLNTDRDAWLNDLGPDRPEPANPRQRHEYAALSYRVLRRSIEDALADRNAGQPDSTRRLEFRQAFHLVYADGQQMLLCGGGLLDEDGRQRWDASGLGELDFVRTSTESFRIDIPVLTRREILHLLRDAPDVAAAAKQAGIPLNDARRFAAAYRYVPRYVEAEDW